MEHGEGCELYKVDLSRAYRQLRSCPRDWPFLVVEWQGRPYVDTAIPFGLRHGASACQRTTEAVIQATGARVTIDACPYIDDTAGVAIPINAQQHYKALLDTMDDLGLQSAPNKCTPPTTYLTWIGVTYDTIKMTMSIDTARIEEALQSCREMFDSKRVTLHKMQKFMGKLYHASKCTAAARPFMSRLVDVLGSLCIRQVMELPVEAKRDIAWFGCFLAGYNGVTMMKPAVAQQLVGVDACLQGLGAVWEGHQYYSVAIPEYCRMLNLSINAWECFNLLVSVRCWADHWRGQTVLIYSDNWATVCAVNSGRAEDPLMRGALRELWLLAANWDIDLRVRHRPGVELVIPDLLSRAMTSAEASCKAGAYMDMVEEGELVVERASLLPPLPL